MTINYLEIKKAWQNPSESEKVEQAFGKEKSLKSCPLEEFLQNPLCVLTLHVSSYMIAMFIQKI